MTAVAGPDVSRRPAAPDAQAPAHADVGILSLSNDPWNWRWNSRHQVLTRLARDFHVLWLEPAEEWRTVVRHGPRPARDSTPAGMPPGFIVRESAGWLPVVYRPAIAGRALLRARLAAARESLLRRGCRRIVLYIWHPSAADALGAVPHDLSCYHIYDEHTNTNGDAPADPVEERLIRSADRVFMVSPSMFERKGGLNPRSLLLSNGVDYEAFAAPGPVPGDLAGIPRPWLGYAGFVKTQLDFHLLDAIAGRHPEWSLVLVGARRVQAELDDLVTHLSRHPNVHFLGARTTTELARYPRHFDACLMPYRESAYSTYTYPLKLNEYLATGRPVVTIPLPALPHGAGLVSAASGVAAWEAALRDALQPDETAPALVAARQAEARRHDWSVIVDRIAGEILQGLATGRATP